MTESELKTRLAEHNPIARLKPLAKAKVPVFHIHGDKDKVVPLELNSEILFKRYRALGGPMELEVVKGQGHNLWLGWFQSKKLTDFVIENALPKSSSNKRASKQAFDLMTPTMTDESPAAGRRVRQVAPEYKGTEVYHALYLPVDWKPGKKYPVIVEYTGNKFPASNSTGQVKDANLGYGLSGGKGFIWISMPYVEKGRKKNALTWWGDREATIDYCKVNLPRICKQFGGDPENVFICGFSRGAIGASYIGLADDEIASLWKGIFTHDHFDGQRNWNYPESDRKSALKRLARLKGRPVLVCGQGATTVRDQYLKDHLKLASFQFLDVPTKKLFNIPQGQIIHPHTDLWMHRESTFRQQARKWLAEVLSKSSRNNK